MWRSIPFLALTAFLVNCGSDQELETHVDTTKLNLVNGILYTNEEDPFEGNVVTSYPTGKIKSKIEYREGRKSGVEKQWYANGKNAIERYYHNGIKVGIHCGWYPNGQQQFEYHFNSNGLYNGLHYEWHKTGHLAKHFNFVNGRETGRQRLWKPNGALKANYEVKNGERFGSIGLKKCMSVIANRLEINQSP